MTLTFDDIDYMNKNLENQVFDRKSIGILSNPHDLAELMTSFGNNKFVSQDFGGIIVIGIKDNGEYEKLEPKQGHEESIMNVAQQNIYPPMTPSFEVVSKDDQNVYAITIPKMTSTPYGLKTSDGVVYKKRVGSTIRDMVYDEIKLLEKDDNDSISKEERVESRFPLKIGPPFIKVTVIPIDANRQLINFDQNNTEWLKSTVPKYGHIRKVTLKQNEIHYESLTFPSTESDWFILNQYGEFSSIEIIKLHESNIVHFGRQTVFLLGILHYLKEVYQKFKYSGRISVKLELGGVQEQIFKNTEFDDPFSVYDRKFTINPLPIKRIVSLDLLNIDSLVTSLMTEVCRACDWTVDESDFHKYLEYLRTKKGITF